MQSTIDHHMYEGDFKDGVAEGRGSYTWPNGDVYEGDYKAGVKEGWGRHTTAAGDVYEGEWRAGVKQGQGKQTWVNGDVYEGNYSGGVRSGQGTYTYANGRVCHSGIWKEGMPESSSSVRPKRVKKTSKAARSASVKLMAIGAFAKAGAARKAAAAWKSSTTNSAESRKEAPPTAPTTEEGGVVEVIWARLRELLSKPGDALHLAGPVLHNEKSFTP